MSDQLKLLANILQRKWEVKVNLAETDFLRSGLAEKDLAPCKSSWQPSASQLKAVTPDRMRA